jgi:tetratricopeptide (TPR) repeat protein
VLDALVRARTQTLEQLASAHSDTIALLKQNLDLNQRQIRAALDILGETNVQPERLATKLLEIAERFKDLQVTAIAKPGDNPKIAALKADAQKAIGAGDLSKADALLADVEAEQRQARERLAANEAETAAQRGDIAMTRLRYGEAARHYADAAAVPVSGSTGEEKRLDYVNREANALFQQGDEFGDNDALRLAIERYRRIRDLEPRERVPLDWAATQNNLGTALMTLGERENSTARLEEAVAAYREALKEWTRERVPLQWAATQTNLGTALETLGERENSAARFEEAVAAYRDALKELTRERVPLRWAMTQDNLGSALSGLGERESGTARLEEAVAAFRDALKELTRERVPIQWAATQTNRAVRGGRRRRRLSRRAQGTDPRARAAPMGDDAEQSRLRAIGAWRA